MTDAGVELVRGRGETASWEESYFHTRRNRRLRSKRLGTFHFQPEEPVVEVGCGDGLDLEILREAGCTRLLGTDISPALLAHVRAAPVCAGDLYALPFRDAALECVLADSVLHHLTSLEPALAELQRVLRPGGRLCVLEPRPTLLRRIVDFAMDRVPFPPPLRARQLTYREERGTYHAWLARFPELERDVARAGFEVTAKRKFLASVGLECRRR